MVDALTALIAKWRDHARFLESLPPASDDERDHADRMRQCADELEAALHAAAPPAPTAEPECCSDAVICPTCGRQVFWNAEQHLVNVREGKIIIERCMSTTLSTGTFPAAPPERVSEGKKTGRHCSAEHGNLGCCVMSAGHDGHHINVNLKTW